MKKFEEEFDKNVDVSTDMMSGRKYCNVNQVKGLGHGWISPEDHQKVVDDLTNARSSITNLMAQLDYYKKDKRFEAMAEEILSLKSQLEKQQPEIPEVPQFVADWYEENKGDLEYRIWGYIRCWNSQEKDDFYNFMNNVKSIETILAMKNGYTVKEKRFYLKNKLTGLYLAIDSSTYIEIEEKWLDAKRITSYKPFFTQQEIDSMAADSYEQIEVGDD